MIDPQSLAEYSSQVTKISSDADLEQRLGLYRVFLKLYEHHRGLLDEILDLENTDNRWRERGSARYVQGVVQGRRVYLVTNLLKGKTQALEQPERVWVVGRDRKLSLPVRDKRLSRRHAAIQYVEGESFYLIDFNSTNGSFVNGEAVRQCIPLKDGDQVRLGSLAFTFFTYSASKATEPIPPDVLEQVNAIRLAIASSPAPSEEDISYSAQPIDWDTPLTTAVEETSMFLLSPNQKNHKPSQEAVSHFSPHQQAEILDRFLKR